MKCLKIMLAIAVLLCGCSEMKDYEYSYERIDLMNGSHIMAIHNSNCPCHKTFFKPTALKSSYAKKKYDIYCSVCWELEEIKQMNLYSKANNMNPIKWDRVNSTSEWEFAKFYSRVIDTTDRVKEVKYALKEDTLVEFDLEALLNKYRYVIWD